MKNFLLKILQKINLTPQKFIVVMAIVVFIPLVGVSFFNHPSVDDFCFAATTNNVGFVDAQMKYYFTWTGRYASTALISLATGFSQWISVYKFIPVGLFLLTFLSIFLFLKLTLSAFFRVKEVKTLTCITLSLILLVMMLTCMPSLVEGFYWASGSLTYQVSFILLMFDLCLVMVHFKGNLKTRILSMIGLVAINILLIGFNEIVMFVVLLLNSLLLIYALKERKSRLSVFLILLVSVFCAYGVIGAPGNAIRSLDLPDKMGFFKAIFFGGNLALNAIFNVLKLMNFWLLLITFILFLPPKNIQINNIKIKQWWIGFIAFLTGLVLCIGTSVPLWVGGYLPLRTVNLLTEIFILGFVVIVSLLFLSHRESFFWIEKIRTNIIAMFLMFSFSIFVITFSTNPIGSGYYDLLSGFAFRYDQQFILRYRQISESQNILSKTLEVDAIQKRPKLLYFDDIQSDPKDWRNVCYADYFKISSIKTK